MVDCAESEADIISRNASMDKSDSGVRSAMFCKRAAATLVRTDELKNDFQSISASRHGSYASTLEESAARSEIKEAETRSMY